MADKNDCINYCKKMYNRCSYYKHSDKYKNSNSCSCHYCKYNYFDLSKVCERCKKSETNCVQYWTLARWDQNIEWVEFGEMINYRKGIKKDIVQDYIIEDRKNYQEGQQRI